jgi:hypothetical protein
VFGLGLGLGLVFGLGLGLGLGLNTCQTQDPVADRIIMQFFFDLIHCQMYAI